MLKNIERATVAFFEVVASVASPGRTPPSQAFLKAAQDCGINTEHASITYNAGPGQDRVAISLPLQTIPVFLAYGLGGHGHTVHDAQTAAALAEKHPVIQFQLQHEGIQSLQSTQAAPVSGFKHNHTVLHMDRKYYEKTFGKTLWQDVAVAALRGITGQARS